MDVTGVTSSWPEIDDEKKIKPSSIKKLFVNFYYRIFAAIKANTNFKKKICQCKHLFIIKRHGDKAKFPYVLPNSLKITDFIITNKRFQ